MLPGLRAIDGEEELWVAPEDSGVCSQLAHSTLREVHEVVTSTMGDHQLSPPNVCLLLVGRHPAAVAYARSTVAAAQSAGVALRMEQLPETATNADVANQIALCNLDKTCHGAAQPLCLHRAPDRGARRACAAHGVLACRSLQGAASCARANFAAPKVSSNRTTTT